MLKQICICFIAALLLTSPVFGQSDDLPGVPNGDFFYFFDGQLIQAGEFTVKKGVLGGKKYFNLNGDRINLDLVRFYQDGDKYFANLSEKTLVGQPMGTFAERMEKGMYDIFVYSTDAPGSVNSSGRYQSGGKAYSYYYTQGFGNLKKVSYDNLYLDLNVFPEGSSPSQQGEVLHWLAKGKKKAKTKKILFWSGLGVGLVGGLIAYSGRDKPSDLDPLIMEGGDPGKQTAGLGISVIGFTGMVVSIWQKPDKSYLKAIKAYNRL